VYNAGFAANEVCERVWSQVPPKVLGSMIDVGLEGDSRSTFMNICRTYRYMSYEAIVSGAKSIRPDVCPELFPEDFSPDVPDKDYKPENLDIPAKMVIFMYDVSYSMTKQVGDTTRMGACKLQLEKMMKNSTIIGRNDSVAVVAFGFGFKYLLPLQPDIGAQVNNLIQDALGDDPAQKGTVRCQNGGPDTTPGPGYPEQCKVLGHATSFYSTLGCLLQDLLQQGGESFKKNLWLIALTDGDPSPLDRAPEVAGRTKDMLRRYCEDSNNIIIIAISDEVTDESEKGFQELTAIAQQGGGNGIYIAAKDVKDDSAINAAFSNVAAALVDVSGMSQEE